MKFQVNDMPAAGPLRPCIVPLPRDFYKLALQPVTWQYCALWRYGGREYGAVTKEVGAEAFLP
jgi:hypothetical protein